MLVCAEAQHRARERSARTPRSTDASSTSSRTLNLRDIRSNTNGTEQSERLHRIDKASMMMRHNSGFFADGGKGFEDVYTPSKCRGVSSRRD